VIANDPFDTRWSLAQEGLGLRSLWGNYQIRPSAAKAVLILSQLRHG
jgi:hypothetical protein